MLRMRWRSRATAVALGLVLAAVLAPAPAQAVAGQYAYSAQVRANTLVYDFGSQTLTGGKSQVSGRIYTVYIYSLNAYDLSVYASSQGSGGTATLSHAAHASLRSACKWNYLGGTPPATHDISCWYYAP